MKKGVGLVEGLVQTVKSVGLMAKGTFYKESPSVRGRMARALAHESKGGKGKIAKRTSYKRDVKKGVKQKSRQMRGKLVRELAKNTKGGKGRISNRPQYKRHLP